MASPLPYFLQGAAPSRGAAHSPGFGQSCTAITWKTHSFANPGCFQARMAPNHRAAVPHAEKFYEELWGRVNLKSWLKRAPNTSLPHSEPLGALAWRSARSSKTGGCCCILRVLLEPAHDPSALPGARQRGAEGSFALCTAQLGLQLLGEASSVF